jgi:hypothetical protein
MAMSTTPEGDMALAVAHMDRNGPVLDKVSIMRVKGGESGIDAVYAGLRAQGLDVRDCRANHPDRATPANVRQRAIDAALERARAS